MIDMKGSGEGVENVMLPVTPFSMNNSVVDQLWSREAYPWRAAQNSAGLCAVPTIRTLPLAVCCNVECI